MGDQGEVAVGEGADDLADALGGELGLSGAQVGVGEKEQGAVQGVAQGLVGGDAVDLREQAERARPSTSTAAANPPSMNWRRPSSTWVAMSCSEATEVAGRESRRSSSVAQARP